MKKGLVFILLFMLAFTGCDKFHKTISGLQNEAEVKEVLNDKTDVKEVVKAEHYTVGDALHLAVSSYFSFQKTAIKVSLSVFGIFLGLGLLATCYSQINH